MSTLPPEPSPSSAPLPPELAGALRRTGLLGPGPLPAACQLAGGVSSDIWRVDLPQGAVCVKRALPRLRVAADWRVPVERSRHEAEWLRRAAAIVPAGVPALLAEDREAGCLVMPYLDPATHGIWKDHLAAGRVVPAVARQVGERLGRIHAATADDPEVAARFATDALFRAIRLEPYLEAAARAHPDRATILEKLVQTTGTTRRVLVHGDVSPKNILVGPRGPVLLDAECAWFGDPAFDLAFCLNHLLLKGVWRPTARARLLDAARILHEAYLARVIWEPPAGVEGRAARLLPGLLLARIDGKSPVEYLSEADRSRVREVSRALLLSPPEDLATLYAAWTEGLATS